MNSPEMVTRSAVWLALTLYATGELAGAVRREGDSAAWWLNIAGCMFFLAHVAAAFHYFYNWSHATAYSDTARQTKAITGWNSGAGLYLDYLFALVWVSETVWARMSPIGYSSRPANWTRIVRAWFLFMIFNGAFVFVHSNIRWFGLLMCASLLFSWRLRTSRGIDWQRSTKPSSIP